ncbi:MAG: hypothetical protein Q9168_002352 [Polycauliona sp. 1 TL-2023]
MLATALALTSAVNAHIKMTTPAPYTANGDLDNSPLEIDGSNFPCKMTSGQYTPPTTKNTMAIGATQTLQLMGGATHGGGSCQISLTKDPKPSKNTKWMVIHSEEGGCPSNAPGNKGEVATAPLEGFQYKIPQGIAPGDYTFAWTWFNKLGNQEMYMNCAPVTVTGGTKKRNVDEASFNETQELASDEIFKRDADFPDMFKANIFGKDTGCMTNAENRGDVVFPDPGKSLTKNPGMSVTPNGGLNAACGASKAAAPASGSSAASPSSGASPAAPSAPAGAGSGTPTVTGEGSDSGSGSSSASGAASPSISIVAIPPPGAAGAAQSSAAAAPSPAATGSAMGTSAPAVPAASAAPASPSGSASSSGSSTGAAAAPGSMPCETPGQSICSADGKMIGTCDTNKMAVMMPVAAGTKCSAGFMVHARRSARFARSYGRHY